MSPFALNPFPSPPAGLLICLPRPPRPAADGLLHVRPTAHPAQPVPAAPQDPRQLPLPALLDTHAQDGALQPPCPGSLHQGRIHVSTTKMKLFCFRDFRSIRSTEEDFAFPFILCLTQRRLGFCLELVQIVKRQPCVLQFVETYSYDLTLVTSLAAFSLSI